MHSGRCVITRGMLREQGAGEAWAKERHWSKWKESFNQTLREHREWQSSVALHIWTPSISMSSTPRNSQHEILEDYAQLFGLFGWHWFKRYFLCYSWRTSECSQSDRRLWKYTKLILNPNIHYRRRALRQLKGRFTQITKEFEKFCSNLSLQRSSVTW